MREHWDIATTWLPTLDIHGPSMLQGYDDIRVVPGTPYFHQRGVHTTVRHARESQLPLLGTYGGFFNALTEHAQNGLGLPEVTGAGETPEKLVPLVTPLTCSFGGEKALLSVEEGSRLSSRSTIA